VSFMTSLIILAFIYDLLENRRIADAINIPFLFLYYIIQVDSMLPCVCLIRNGSQKTSKWDKNISYTLGYYLVCHFVFLPHVDVICDLLLNRRTATWNLSVNLKFSTPHNLIFRSFELFVKLHDNVWVCIITRTVTFGIISVNLRNN